MTTPRIAAKQNRRKALRNIGKNLLFLLRNRRRRRLNLAKLPFCMKRILYKTEIRSPRKEAHIVNHISLDRESFPALAANDYVYLNSGGSGPPPYTVIEAMRVADDLCSGPAYLEGVGYYALQAEVASRAREAAARIIGAAPEDIALTQNTTHGMNLGVASIDWREGDEVVSTTTEHPGCLVPLHALERRFGVMVSLIPPPVTAEKVEAAMGPRTRIVALSHVDWTSGKVLPLEEICTRARERDVLTLIDGAQSVGDIPVDVPATGADMYAFTGHKWVLGPEGMGAFYVRPGCDVPSTNVGFLSLPDPAAFDAEGGYELRADARRFEASTMSPVLAAGFAAAAEAVQERGEAGFEGIRHRADLLASLLSYLPHVTLRSPRPANSGIVSFEVEGVAAKEVTERLLEKEFVLRYIPGPRSYVRTSTHLFNTEEEIEALVQTLGGL
jgi:selenocysteine lyase/cysteine desulfurase